MSSGEVRSRHETKQQPLREQHMMAIVEYDGTEYSGFQVQRSVRTIQGEIEGALESVVGCPTRIVGAGRTDAGVHAKGQVVHFDVSWRHSVADLHRALNAVLPKDIAFVDRSSRDTHITVPVRWIRERWIVPVLALSAGTTLCPSAGRLRARTRCVLW
jgi:hypothetical protein